MRGRGRAFAPARVRTCAHMRSHEATAAIWPEYETPTASDSKIQAIQATWHQADDMLKCC